MNLEGTWKEAVAYYLDIFLRGLKKPRIAPSRVAGLQNKIQTQDFPNREKGDLLLFILKLIILYYIFLVIQKPTRYKLLYPAPLLQMSCRILRFSEN
jgi:hypothetical protein